MIVLKGGEGTGVRERGVLFWQQGGDCIIKPERKRRGESVVGKSAWEDLLSSVYLDPCQVFPIGK